MSVAERAYKARREAQRRQGVLTAELKEKLRDDLLSLLDSKAHPKNSDKIKDQLIEFLGWKPDQIFGPEDWVWKVLDELRSEELIRWRGPDNALVLEWVFWRCFDPPVVDTFWQQ